MAWLVLVWAAVSPVLRFMVLILYIWLRPAAISHCDEWMSIHMWLTQCIISHILATHIRNQIDWWINDWIICLTVEALNLHIRDKTHWRQSLLIGLWANVLHLSKGRFYHLNEVQLIQLNEESSNWRSSAWFSLSLRRNLSMRHCVPRQDSSGLKLDIDFILSF